MSDNRRLQPQDGQQLQRVSAARSRLDVRVSSRDPQSSAEALEFFGFSLHETKEIATLTSHQGILVAAENAQIGRQEA
jgi:hypothetical protein